MHLDRTKLSDADTARRAVHAWHLFSECPPALFIVSDNNHKACMMCGNVAVAHLITLSIGFIKIRSGRVNSSM